MIYYTDEARKVLYQVPEESSGTLIFSEQSLIPIDKAEAISVLTGNGFTVSEDVDHNPGYLSAYMSRSPEGFSDDDSA